MQISLSTAAPIIEIIVAISGLAAFLAGIKYLGHWIKERDDEVKELREIVSIHIANAQIHTDPIRDERRWQELLSTVGKLSESMTKLSESFIAHRASFEAFLVTRSAPPIIHVDRKEP